MDFVVRALLLRQADDEGAALWAMSAEAIRVADRQKGDELRELPGAAQIGLRKVPTLSNSYSYSFGGSAPSHTLMFRYEFGRREEE